VTQIHTHSTGYQASLSKQNTQKYFEQDDSKNIVKARTFINQ